MDVKKDRIKPAVKYPGSKWRIADEIVKLMPEHHSYLEPYFGSGAVLFNKEPSNIETINDIDDDVINLFECIRKDPDLLAHMVDYTPFSRNVYEQAFIKKSKDPFEQALEFLIRCWQGYGFRTSGEKTGWKNDVQGRERAYALKNWNEVPETLKQVCRRLKMVQIEHRPAIELIKKFDYKNVFMYLDPPYIRSSRRSSRKQYKNEMDDKEHMELLDTITASNAKIMISGYDSDLYNEILKNWNRIETSSNDSTGCRTNEVLWMNYNACGQLNIFEEI